MLPYRQNVFCAWEMTNNFPYYRGNFSSSVLTCLCNSLLASHQVSEKAFKFQNMLNVSHKSQLGTKYFKTQNHGSSLQYKLD